MSDGYLKGGLPKGYRKGLKVRDKNGKNQRAQASFFMDEGAHEMFKELRDADVNMSEIFRRCIAAAYDELRSKDETKSK
jgi:hypothetical protein